MLIAVPIRLIYNVMCYVPPSIAQECAYVNILTLDWRIFITSTLQRKCGRIYNKFGRNFSFAKGMKRKKRHLSEFLIYQLLTSSLLTISVSMCQ